MIRECARCERTFDNGVDKWECFCPTCLAFIKRVDAHDSAPGAHRVTGYARDRNKRGASREANRILRERASNSG